MLGKIPAARLAVTEKIVALAVRHVPASRRAMTRDFVRGYFRGVAEEDLRLHSPARLSAAAVAHLDFGVRRAVGEVLIDLAPPLASGTPAAAHRALLRIVATDMPFLVDSVGLVFARMGIGVHLIVHPVLEVRRDA